MISKGPMLWFPLGLQPAKFARANDGLRHDVKRKRRNQKKTKKKSSRARGRRGPAAR